MNTSLSSDLTLHSLRLFPSIYDSHLKPTFPASLWIFMELLLILSYTVKPTPHRPLVFLVPLLCLIVYSLLFTRMRKLDHVGNTEWGMSCRLAANVLFASTNILLCDVQKELKIVNPKSRRAALKNKQDDDENKHEKKKENRDVRISDESFYKRFKWAFKLWFTPRGVNFEHEVGKEVIPRPDYPTRTSFILHQTFYLLYNLLVYDVTLIICRANPYFSGRPSLYPSGYEAVLWRLLGFHFGVLVYLVLMIEYKMASLVFVGLGLSEIDDWPDMFGSFKHAYTLRGLWGKTWHQMFRRPTVAHAQYFCRKLKIPPKSQLTPFFILFCVFALTGLLHHVGDAVAMQSWTKSGALHFFLLQAVGIVIEDVVMKLLKGNGNSNPSTEHSAPECPEDVEQVKWTTKLLGYSWVIVWLAMTLPLWMDPLFRNGTFIKELPHFSVVLGLWRGEWSFEAQGWPLIPKPDFD